MRLERCKSFENECLFIVKRNTNSARVREAGVISCHWEGRSRGGCRRIWAVNNFRW